MSKYGHYEGAVTESPCGKLMADYRGQNDRTDGSVTTASLKGWKKLSVWANTTAFHTLAPLLIPSPCQQLSFMVWFGGEGCFIFYRHFLYFQFVKDSKNAFRNSLRPQPRKVFSVISIKNNSKISILYNCQENIIFILLWIIGCSAFEKFCKNQLGIFNILRLHPANTNT